MNENFTGRFLLLGVSWFGHSENPSLCEHPEMLKETKYYLLKCRACLKKIKKDVPWPETKKKVKPRVIGQ